MRVRDVVNRMSISSVDLPLLVRCDFKMIPECARETDLHPERTLSRDRSLLTLNFPRAALVCPSFSSFFFPRASFFFLRSPKKLVGTVILRRPPFFLSTRNATLAPLGAPFTPSLFRAITDRLCNLREDYFFFFYNRRGKSNVDPTPFFLSSLKPRTSSCVFDQEEGR